VRVDSLADLPAEPLWSIVKHRVWSTIGRGEWGLERDWQRVWSVTVMVAEI
jgi:hypothetical protein